MPEFASNDSCDDVYRSDPLKDFLTYTENGDFKLMSNRIEDMKSRPQIGRRFENLNWNYQEAFMGPLLCQHIHSAIRDWKERAVNGRPTVLDLGCGNQPFRRYLEERGFEYHSADVQQNELKNVEFIFAIDKQLPNSMLSKRFDFILCSEVLEHVADWKSAFANMNSLLDMGGEILITVPFHFPLHEEPFDFYRPTSHAFQLFAGQSNLRIEKLIRLGNTADVFGTLLGTMLDETYRKPMNILDRCFQAITRRLIQAFLKALHRSAKKGVIRSVFDSNAKHYLSNACHLIRID